MLCRFVCWLLALSNTHTHTRAFTSASHPGRQASDPVVGDVVDALPVADSAVDGVVVVEVLFGRNAMQH